MPLRVGITGKYKIISHVSIKANLRIFYYLPILIDHAFLLSAL